MRRLIAPGWPGNLLAVVAGAITTLALAPFDLWPFALVAVGSVLYRPAGTDTPSGPGPWLVFRFRPVRRGDQLDLLQHPPLRRRFGAAGGVLDAAVHRRHCLVLRPARLAVGALAAPQ